MNGEIDMEKNNVNFLEIIDIQKLYNSILIITKKKIIVERFEHVSSYQYQTVTGE